MLDLVNIFRTLLVKVLIEINRHHITYSNAMSVQLV